MERRRILLVAALESGVGWMISAYEMFDNFVHSPPMWLNNLIIFSPLVVIPAWLYRREIKSWLQSWFRKAPSGKTTYNSNVVDYIEAGAIIDRYIHSAVVDKRDIVKLTIRKDFTDRFDKVSRRQTGRVCVQR